MNELSVRMAQFKIKMKHITYDACQKLDDLKVELRLDYKTDIERSYDDAKMSGTVRRYIARCRSSKQLAAEAQMNAANQYNSHLAVGIAAQQAAAREWHWD